MDPVREPDLTNIYFENTSFPLTQESWFQWLSLSYPNGFFDANPGIELSLDQDKLEPRLFVLTKRAREGKKEPRMKMYVLDSVCFQAPPVARVCLGRINSAAYYLDEAIAKLGEKKKRFEREEKEEPTEEKKKARKDGDDLIDVEFLKVFDEELFKE
jgi:hypothetical protein